MSDKTREDFEAWAKSKGAPKEGWWIRQIDDGGYSCGPVDDAWNGYQAATQHSAARIAELEAEAEGHHEAFGAIVDQKRFLADRVKQIEHTIQSQQAVIVKMRQERDAAIARAAIEAERGGA